MKPAIFIKLSGLLVAGILCMPLSGMTEAKRISTKIKAPASSYRDTIKLKTYPHHESEFEKVNDHLAFMAYDKKGSASKETFFVDNGSNENLSAIEIEISYYNSAGKQSHRRTVEINQDFPAKETRKVDIPSWDTQKSYHYINSLPSQKGSTPYTVKFRVLSFMTGSD